MKNHGNPKDNIHLFWHQMTFYELIREDAKTILEFEKKCLNFKNILWLIFGLDAYIILFIFRIRKLCIKYKIPLINRILRAFHTIFYSIELDSSIELGPGVYFIHSLGTVVGSGAILDKGVVLYGNNTVGAAHEKDSPYIGKYVKIGAGARVLGEITVGNHALIGANSVVVKDIDQKVTVAGIPAKPIHKGP